MQTYEITFEIKEDRFHPKFLLICKYATYSYDWLNELAWAAYNDYRRILSYIIKVRETIIFFDEHVSPLLTIWVRRNRLWIDAEPICKALFYERVRQSPVRIPPINIGESGCSERYTKQLQEKYSSTEEKKT